MPNGRPRAATHFCPGKCGRTVQNTLFACPGCWSRLPHELQTAITDNFLVNPAAHFEAMRAASAWYLANRRVAQIEERCELTELLIDQCGCREHRGGRDPDEQLVQERALLLAKPGWVPARFEGSCGCCGEGFPEGAAIHAISTGGWRAECCAEAT